MLLCLPAGCEAGVVSEYGPQWPPPAECDLCQRSNCGHVGWGTDPLCGGWLHCGVDGCLTCGHQRRVLLLDSEMLAAVGT